MAEGLLRDLAGDHFEVFSAGTHPSQVNPLAIAAMDEKGIDLSLHYSKSVDEFAGQQFDTVITVCDNAQEACPVWPGANTIHHSFTDPAAAAGSDDERLAVFRRVRDEIETWMTTFVQQ